MNQEIKKKIDSFTDGADHFIVVKNNEIINEYSGDYVRKNLLNGFIFNCKNYKLKPVTSFQHYSLEYRRFDYCYNDILNNGTVNHYEYIYIVKER